MYNKKKGSNMFFSKKVFLLLLATIILQALLLLSALIWSCTPVVGYMFLELYIFFILGGLIFIVADYKEERSQLMKYYFGISFILIVLFSYIYSLRTVFVEEIYSAKKINDTFCLENKFLVNGTFIVKTKEGNITNGYVVGGYKIFNTPLKTIIVKKVK